MEHNISDVEASVCKFMIAFTKALPLHRDRWKSTLQETVRPVKSLVNLAEQLRHVESAKIRHMEDFESTQSQLQHLILSRVEEEVATLKQLTAHLTKSNGDIRNKLVAFENSTLDLDWGEEEESLLIKGHATQPPLAKLLQMSLEHYNYFAKALKNINSYLRALDLRKEEEMMSLEKAFKVDLEVEVVQYLIALTQYIDNAKTVT